MSIKYHLVQGNGNVDSAHGKNGNGHYCHVLSFILWYRLKSLVKFRATLCTTQLVRVGFCPEELLMVMQSSVSPGVHLVAVHKLRLHLSRKKCQCVVEESGNSLEREGWRLAAEVCSRY